MITKAKPTEKGLEEIETFFNNPDAKYIWQDYLYYGRLLNKAKQYDQAADALQKAIKESSSHTEIYKDLAEVYSNSENNAEAIKAYTQYIEALGEESEAAVTTNYVNITIQRCKR